MVYLKFNISCVVSSKIQNLTILLYVCFILARVMLLFEFRLLDRKKSHYKNKMMLEIVKSSSSLRTFITNKQANRYFDKTSYTTKFG